MPQDDLIRLRHMYDASLEAMAYLKGRDRSDLDQDHIGTLGLVKCLEIIGEAAARVEEETRQRFPQIPWVRIIAMRNRLVHAYFDVDLDQVWLTVTEDLPPLVFELEQMLKDKET